MLFEKITDEQLQTEIDDAPCPVRFEAMENWGTLSYDLQQNQKSQLYRIQPTVIRVREDLTSEQKFAATVHEVEHARDLVRPSTLEPQQDLTRAETAAYQGTLSELLKRRVYLPLLWEMYTIEWDAEGQGTCFYHRDAALAVYNSSLWDECRQRLLEAMNADMPPILPTKITWAGHENAELIDTGGPHLVVEFNDGKIVDFQITKMWSPDGASPIEMSQDQT